MKKTLMILLICVLLWIAPGCTNRETETPSAAEPQTTGTTFSVPSDIFSPSASETERGTAAEVQTVGAVPIRKLPGHIESDVYVRLRDGNVAPGLRDEDAQTVKRILASQTWGMSCDTLSDMWIEAEGVRYAYDTSSGILTAADGRAAKLDGVQRETLNAVLAEYADVLAQ